MRAEKIAVLCGLVYNKKKASAYAAGGFQITERQETKIE